MDCIYPETFFFSLLVFERMSLRVRYRVLDMLSYVSRSLAHACAVVTAPFKDGWTIDMDDDMIAWCWVFAFCLNFLRN